MQHYKREPANRNGAEFRCLSCGYSQHADANAANNIARALETFGPCARSSAHDESLGLRFEGKGPEPALSLGAVKPLFDLAEEAHAQKAVAT